ncbi:hypothetical protein KOR42_29530 [Thalassoglobus neptunius]|uniref:Uncharacterized protein n=1 Tax=Thalassoglobus neptunius TaxID=1938619 RepID=A0A5C5WZH2_9PLAN|nr:hypothetical protein KOR42_29530 [Thalassoglobus neptunius]
MFQVLDVIQHAACSCLFSNAESTSVNEIHSTPTIAKQGRSGKTEVQSQASYSSHFEVAHICLSVC